MKIDKDVLEVLDQAEADGNMLRLASQLDRALYVKTDKVLKALGGKWNRGARAHVFTCDAKEAVDNILLAGEITLPKDMGYFQTQPEMVKRVIRLAAPKMGESWLEPSAGGGALAVALAATAGMDNGTCIELDPKRAANLKVLGFNVIQGNFLDQEVIPAYDVVVMNPPFAKQEDIRHVLHARRFLKRGGRLVAIMSAGVQFRQNSVTRLFRQVVDEAGGTIEENPAGAFKASGTMVNTVTVSMGVD